MQQKISNLLRELEKTRHLFWNISPETGQFLNLLIRERKYRTVLEIGTSNGYSGIWIAEALSHTNGHLYTIESHMKERFGLATENFRKAELIKFITQISGHAPEVIPSKPKMFDLIFLDATKYEHPLYLEALKNRIKKGGMIIADNAGTHTKELSSYFKMANKLFESNLLNIGSGLFVSIKN